MRRRVRGETEGGGGGETEREREKERERGRQVAKLSKAQHMTQSFPCLFQMFSDFVPLSLRKSH